MAREQTLKAKDLAFQDHLCRFVVFLQVCNSSICTVSSLHSSLPGPPRGSEGALSVMLCDACPLLANVELPATRHVHRTVTQRRGALTRRCAQS